MSSLTRRLSLVVLLALLAAALPAARVALAQSQPIIVNSTLDTDNGTCPSVCTLREAIRRANASGADTINFNITSGTAPFYINVATELPELSGGSTTINVSPAHSVVLSGAGTSGSAFGLRITSAGNVVRGLVIVGFPNLVNNSSLGGSGILLTTAASTGNLIANNWIGLDVDGTTFGNTYYGIQIDQEASNNTIGGTAAGDGNVITGNLQANIALEDSDNLSTAPIPYISGNQIIGNYIGTNTAGTGIPSDVRQTNLTAGVLVGTWARNTLIKNNVIGGHLGNPINSINPTAGIVVRSMAAAVSSDKHPQDTVIVGNHIGTTAAGGNLANHNGISLVRGAIRTTIGDPTDPVGGRNVIGFSQDSGIILTDELPAYNITDTKIVGNYIGLADNGTTLATIGTANNTSYKNTAIYLGGVTAGSPDPATIIGPANLIASARRYGIQVRSNANTIKGNFIGTNAAGTANSPTSFTSAATVGYGFGEPAIWVENGSGNRIGGTGGDRNVIAAGSTYGSPSAAAILLMPGSGFSVTNTTVQGNYLGIRSTGDAALASPVDPNTDGLRITGGSSGNTVSGNAISGLGFGIALYNGSNNTISGNRIGTRASGASDVLDLPQAIRNERNGIKVLQGTGNQITANTIAFNGNEALGSNNYYGYGIIVENTTGGANNNTLSGNTLVRNGDGLTNSGIYINGPTGILITKTTTSNHKGDGITFGTAGTNGDISPPTLSGASGSQTAATLSGSASCSSGNCTVEVFTSNVSEDKEGPVYLTSATTTNGAFSINITGCQRYLTATVRDNPTKNTSPFSTVLDSGATGPCVDSSFSLGVASPNTQSVALGSSYTYSHIITNNARVARTFTVVLTTIGWASAPTQVTVPAGPGGSASFNVVVSVPYTAKVSPTADVDTTSIQVFAGSTGSNVVSDITTAKLLTLNPATPAVSAGYAQTRGATTMTFTHSVTNTGDLAGIFSVVGPGGTGSLPTFVGTPPTGWTIASATLTQTNLAGGAHTNLTITVNTPDGTPANPLLAGSVQFSFRIKAATGAQTDPATTDTITVPVAHNFTFVATNPTGSPPTLSRPPGAAADFVYTLTNTGNATDSFHVPAPANASPLSFSVSPSGNFSLAPAASRTVTVTAQVASGASQGDYNFSVTAQAVGGTPVVAPVAGKVTVTGGGTPIFVGTAGVTPDPVAAGSQVTIVHTVKNGGNADVAFGFAVPSLPAGWTTQSQTNTCLALVPHDGSTCTITTVVNVPASADGGSYSVTVSATAKNSTLLPTPSADLTVSATATVNVAIVRDVSLSTATPAATQSGSAGTVLTYVHTLTNLGNATDSFDLTFTPTFPAIAAMAVLSPASLASVPRNATRTVQLVVTVPSGVAAGDLTFSVTAKSQGDATKTATQIDTATVEAFDAASISEGTSKNGLPNTSVTFTHTLTNTGSTPIAFYITTGNSQAGFTSTISSGSPTAVLNPGDKTTISVQVTLPSGVSGGTANITTVEVRKDSPSGTILDSATDEFAGRQHLRR